jgi:hypothetical protein
MPRRQNNPSLCTLEYQVVTGYPTLGRVEGRWDVDGDGVCEADEAVGVWAVNRELAEGEPGDAEYGKGWNVTHVPTGYAIATQLPTRKVALALAKRLRELGWDDIESGDPAVAAQQAIALGGVELVTFILQARHAKMSAAKLEAALAKWKPGSRAPKGAKKPTKKKAPTPKARARKPTREARAAKPDTGKKKTKKKTKKRGKKREKAVEAAPVEIDLIEMARRARGENPADLPPGQASAKARCLW